MSLLCVACNRSTVHTKEGFCRECYGEYELRCQLEKEIKRGMEVDAKCVELMKENACLKEELNELRQKGLALLAEESQRLGFY